MRVREIMKKHGVIVVHGIWTKEMSRNAPKHLSWPGRKLEWDEKLMRLINDSPTISASTMRKGDSSHNLWGYMGAILNDGNVEFAREKDMDSVIVEGRRMPSAFGLVQDYNKSIEEQVEGAIQNRNGTRNELIIKDPKVAGFYFMLETRVRNMVGYKEPSEICYTLTQLDIPLYVVHDGELFPAQYNDDKKWFDFNLKRATTVDEILQSEYTMEEEQ